MIDFTLPNNTFNNDEIMPDLDEFMTTKEAAEKLGFHVKTIPGMMKDKELDGIRFGRTWLVSRKSVDDYGQSEGYVEPSSSESSNGCPDGCDYRKHQGVILKGIFPLTVSRKPTMSPAASFTAQLL